MFPTNKLLLPLSETKTNVILLLNGCFNPIHRHHLRLLELARDHLQSLNRYHVIGGYLSPCHDASIERKISTTYLTWQNRLEMCRLALEDSSWIMIDDWQISQEKNPGAQQSKQRLTDLVKRRYPSVEILSICGGDALPKFKTTFKKELVICIINRPIVEFDFDQWYHSDSIKPYHDHILLIYDQCKDISSSSIREQISLNRHDLIREDLHPSVLEYHSRNNICYRSMDETILWSEFDEEQIELGQGRCATVYEKKYRNELVAVKVIRERKQFVNESKVLLVLIEDRGYHPNVIRILGIGNQFFVMEKCETDLLSYLTQHRFAENQTLEIKYPNSHWMEWIKQMLNGFVHLISLGILHRDIKTDNILLINNTIKISDFSVSINVNTMSKMPPRGSIRHYSPESIEDKTIYTEQSDVYMFGCLLYEIVHGGERLWHSLNTHQVVQRRSKGDKPRFLVPCEDWYIQLVNEQCWSIDIDQRAKFEQLNEYFLLKQNE